MSTVEARGITVGELADALRAADPRAVLVPARILRRVIRGVRGIDKFFEPIPHRGGFATSTAAALEHAEPEELGLPGDGPRPDRLILLAEPDLDRVEGLPREDVLLRYWRALFHARVHIAFDERTDVDADGVEARVARLGRLELAEARAVLVEDGYLTLPADDRSTYVEFAATYLELAAFHPEILPHTFPAIVDHDAVRALLAADVDPDALLDATRPPGAPADPAAARAMEEVVEANVEEPVAEGAAEPDPPRAKSLRAAADAATGRGNNVRAAILRAQAARLAQGRERSRDLAAARGELEKLARRLRAVVGPHSDEGGRWARALPPFLARASRGHWSREARLLYDLQRVCLDRERPISAIDLVGWITSFGRRPLRRPMPDQHEVMILKHLRAAARRARSLRGPEPARGELERLIATAIGRQGRAIRVRFREPIRGILEGVSLCPRNAPERVAGRKLVEELLDLIVERGYLRIGDLRDAISRNSLKLSDLSGPREFLRGDPLLRADDALARRLDGIYHRGEVYLRALQRASALAFGTKVGRWLSRYVALPFGAAFVALEGLQHIIGPIVHMTTGAEVHLFNRVTHAVLGLLLLGILNSRRFRGAFFLLCRGAGLGLRAVFYDVPAWLVRRPLIRWVVSSRTFLLGWNWGLKPFLLLLLLNLGVRALLPADWVQEPHYGLPYEIWRALEGSAWLLLAIVANSRSGRVFEEIAADGATRLGQRIWRDLLPNVFRGVMDFFRTALEAVERLLYGVDEWLRFRGGEGRLSLAGKAVLGLLWAVVAYVARIYVNLLIEPQVNPIKHFPVVTVSHKIMLPMVPQVHRLLRTPLMPLGRVLANGIAGATVFLIPGVFGFLVWELKENWRLYAANRPKTLRPVAFGHHGETMSRLLRRGFHSGTVPKLYARLRKADRRAERGRGEGPVERRLEQIHHVEEGVRAFLERGVVSILGESRSFGPSRISVGEIESATGRIVVALRDRGDAASAARIAFEESNRQLRVRLLDPGWIAGLDAEARRVVASALAGLCAVSDADLAIEPGTGVALDARSLSPAWSSWVASWQGDADGRGHRMVVPDACRLLPDPVSEPGTTR